MMIQIAKGVMLTYDIDFQLYVEGGVDKQERPNAY